ncbi:MAG: hypothetical protein LBC20_09335 [Planctomycetaceae bacterium]|jgi:hypothetical protein|nr:hypothetical protein [Planctomycetaceae bacterium]
MKKNKKYYRPKKIYTPPRHFTPKELWDYYKKEPVELFFLILAFILIPLIILLWNGNVPQYCGLGWWKI